METRNGRRQEKDKYNNFSINSVDNVNDNTESSSSDNTDASNPDIITTGSKVSQLPQELLKRLKGFGTHAASRVPLFDNNERHFNDWLLQLTYYWLL